MTAHAHARPRPALHPPASPQRTPARGRLAAAIAQRDVQQAELQSANAKDTAQRTQAAIGDVEATIRAHQAAAYRAQAESGDGAAPTIDIPPALAERRERARTAAAAAAAAESAFASIQAEQAAAAATAKGSEADVHSAARAVLVELADEVTEQLEAALVHVFLLSDQLEALARFSAPNHAAGETWRDGNLRLSPAAARRATTPLDWRPGLPLPQSYAGRRLSAISILFAALKADADAELER